jgi:hypothetical protein
MIYVGVITLDMGGVEVAAFTSKYLADNWALELYHKHVVDSICQETGEPTPGRFETMERAREWFFEMTGKYDDYEHRAFFEEIHFDYYAYPRSVNTPRKMYGSVIPLFRNDPKGIDWERYRRQGAKASARKAPRKVAS